MTTRRIPLAAMMPAFAIALSAPTPGCQASPNDKDSRGDESDSSAGAETDADTSAIDGNDLDAAASAKLLGETERDGEGGPTIAGWIAVAGAGDVDGDGHLDVVVGLPGYGSSKDGGAAYLLRGPVSGVSSLAAADARLLGAEIENAGYAVSSAGDTNADGFDDLLVGAPNYASGDYLEDEGQVYLMLGPTSGDLQLLDSSAVLQGEPTGGYPYWLDSYTGSSLDGVGDTNGDGFDDILIAAWGTWNAYLLLGPIEGHLDLALDADAQFDPEAFYDVPGEGVAGAGDTDGDGLPDLLFSKKSADDDDVVALFRSPVSGVLVMSDADSVFEHSHNDQVGEAPAGAGDVSGDGYADVAIDAAGEYDLWRGAAYVAMAPFDSVVHLETSAAKVTGEEIDSYAGAAVDGAGDIDADGFGDLLIGSHGTGGFKAGSAYVVFGPIEGTVSLGDTGTHYIGDGDDNAGLSVAGAGDIDSDGFPDILIGGPLDDDGAENAGAAWLISGATIPR